MQALQTEPSNYDASPQPGPLQLTASRRISQLYDAMLAPSATSLMSW